MRLGILCYSVATLLCGFAWNYWSMLVYRLFVGLEMAGEYAAGTTLLLESWQRQFATRQAGSGSRVGPRAAC
jgi:SHS family sialic acid transporter-like MFS transporter